MKHDYVASVLHAWAILCGAVALVTVGASLFSLASPLELFCAGVIGGIPLALLAPLFDDADHRADRLALALLGTFLSTIAFACAEVLISWLS